MCLFFQFLWYSPVLLFSSGLVNIGEYLPRSVSVNIHQYSLHLRQIIVKLCAEYLIENETNVYLQQHTHSRRYAMHTVMTFRNISFRNIFHYARYIYHYARYIFHYARYIYHYARYIYQGWGTTNKLFLFWLYQRIYGYALWNK
jgi:hypothetical protein